jgi:hypothetical protein
MTTNESSRDRINVAAPPLFLSRRAPDAIEIVLQLPQHRGGADHQDSNADQCCNPTFLGPSYTLQHRIDRTGTFVSE